MNKGLEALINIKDSITNDGSILEHTKQYKTIIQELDRLEKLEKAIDILKHHSSIEFLNCTMNYFPIAIKENKEEECDYTIINVESKENYDLLKEVFKNKED